MASIPAALPATTSRPSTFRAAVSAGKPPERGQRLLDVGRDVIVRDLKAYFFLTLGYDREAQARRQDAAFAQVHDEPSRARRVAHQPRHDRMLTRDRLQSEPGEAITKARGHGAQMP